MWQANDGTTTLTALFMDKVRKGELDMTAYRRRAYSACQSRQKYDDLKGLCHEDFAILGQFCAKIIT